MSVVPELREALVRAAEREAAADRPRAAWRLHLGGLGVALAGAVAIAVVAVVIVFGGSGPGRPTGSPGPTVTTRAEALAQRVLAELQLPAGARPVPAPNLRRYPHLRAPGFTLHEPHTLTITRFWVVTGHPQAVVGRVSDRLQIEYGDSPVSGIRTASGRFIPQTSWASDALGFAADHGISSQLSVVLVAIPGGSSLVRIDAEVGWQDSRAAGAVLPSGIDRLLITVPRSLMRQFHLPRQREITSPSKVRLLTSLMNDLPLWKQSGMPCLAPDSPGLIAVQFLRGGSSRPVATAGFDRVCGVAHWILGSRQEPALTWLAPDASMAQENLGSNAIGILLGGPHSAPPPTSGQSAGPASGSAITTPTRSG